MRLSLACSFAIAISIAVVPSARALDKQAPAHAGGGGQGDDTARSISGALFFGAMPVNPSYAARPDNSGLAGLRAGGHVDVNLIGSRLFVPVDVNLFTDRCSSWLRPSELDVIAGVATAWPLARGQIELGTRVEHDGAIDGSAHTRSCNPATGPNAGSGQTYGDVRARYAFALGEWWPALRPALANGDVTGYLTLGWFAVNPIRGMGADAHPSYYARPDNTGRALFRYAAHAGASIWDRRLSFAVDTTFFTDRESAPLRPSELDLTLDLYTTLGGGRYEAHLVYERDMIIDGGGVDSGYVQQMLMAFGSWAFEVPLGGGGGK